LLSAERLNYINSYDINLDFLPPCLQRCNDIADIPFAPQMCASEEYIHGFQLLACLDQFEDIYFDEEIKIFSYCQL